MSIRIKYELSLNKENESSYYDFDDLLEEFIRDISWGTFRKELSAVNKSLPNEDYKISPHLVEQDLSPETNNYKFTLEFNDNQFDFNGEGLNHFIGTIAGDVIQNKKIKLIKIDDFLFDEKICDWFPGPNISVDELKNSFFQDTLLSPRPLLAFSIKPRVGLSTDLYKQLIQEASSTNIDIIEDDERLISPLNCTFESRIQAIKEIIESGTSKSKFSVNLSGDPHKIHDKVLAAYNSGIRMFKLDVMVSGFDTLLYLRNLLDNSGFEPCVITVFPDVYGAYYRGLSRKFILKLCRLCGANIIYAGSPFPSRMGEIKDNYSKTWIKDIKGWMNQCNINHNLLLGEFSNGKNIKTTLPTITHDVDPVLMEILIYSLRNMKGNHMDYAFFIGGGISGFPCDLSLEQSARLWKEVNEFAGKNDECLTADLEKLETIKGFNFAAYEDCMREAGLTPSPFI